MPAKIYKCKDGKRVPSVTILIKKYQNPGGLIHWAWKEGIEGRDYRETRNAAASSGTHVHNAVEAEIKGLPYDMDKIPFAPDEREAVEKGLNGFREWKEMVRFEFVGSEVELVSELYRYGGTLDIVGRTGDHWALIDLKTGKTHESHLYQGAGYILLWNENHPDMQIDRFFSLQVNKETGAFKFNYHDMDPDMNDAIEVFLGLRAIYDAGKRVEKYV